MGFGGRGPEGDVQRRLTTVSQHVPLNDSLTHPRTTLEDPQGQSKF